MGTGIAGVAAPRAAEPCREWRLVPLAGHRAVARSFGRWEGGSALEAILATDVGSTTTKAILLERQPSGWRLAGREEAPTTVESPYEDVTIGIAQAVGRLEQVTGRKLLERGEVVAPRRGGVGADLYISTSSAGGGLQMVSAGLVAKYSAGSAERAALGAGAIVSRALSILDARLGADAIDLLRRLHPDIILLCGGTDQGNVASVVSVAEYLAVAAPPPRHGAGRLPVVYAGNPLARAEVERLLGERFELTMVENVRPSVECEVLEPARREVHRVFLEHVMSRAPGYDRLLRWSARRLEPTPRAVGVMMEMFARDHNASIMGIDIGGATTDVFTVLQGRFTRSVSANLGLSYSAGNVLQRAGLDTLARWLPYEADPDELLDSIHNKMIRPTTLPETTEELMLEHALAREAIRMAVERHWAVAQVPDAARRPAAANETDLLGRRPARASMPSAVIGSGGPLCHAPRRVQAALIMADALDLAGVVDLFVDSVFMLPHLGVLAGSYPDIAREVFERDCLVRLGTLFAARLPPWGREGQVAVRAVVRVEGPGAGGDATAADIVLRAGEIALVKLPPDRIARVELFPRAGVDFGRGPGRLQTHLAQGGEVGLLFDVRGRPVRTHGGAEAQRRRLRGWLEALGAYPGMGPSRPSGSGFLPPPAAAGQLGGSDGDGN